MLKLTDFGYIKNFYKILTAISVGDKTISIEFDSISFSWMGADLEAQYKSEGEIIATEDYFCVPADFTFKLNSNGKLRVYYEN